MPAHRGKPEDPAAPGWREQLAVAPTPDRSQIMFSESQLNVRDYADGDRRGLAVMGTQACVPEV